ncbi:monocarboxylate transporter 12-like [Acanthaster planci]|uniref:Monocarboxylate transporter 12-like n=1 Tax=Acanthaster planci TaxID=133434 RepID=A0A8B7YR33_ACAPL|nr:monocarboxylate transporter 12-like [Acanthaster planci]XP_022093877.1 monocarboxylate transporter 12-like [Acanthaster planci]
MNSKATTSDCGRGRRLEGCRRSIVVVAAAHLATALVTMPVSCASVLYLSWKNEFDSSAKDTAVVMSLVICMTLCCCLLGGVLTKRYGCRFSGMLGGALCSLGFLCSHWATDLVHLYITAAIIGTGAGLVYCSSMVTVAQRFKKHYKAANSVAYAGFGTGTMAGPPVVQLLLDSFGWRGAMLVTSAFAANMVPLCAFFRPPDPLDRSRLEPGPRGDELHHLRGAEEDVPSLGEDGVFDAGKECSVSQTAQDGNNDRETTGCSYFPHVMREGRITRMCQGAVTGLGLDTLLKSYRFTLLCILIFGFHMPYTAFVQFAIPRAEGIEVAPSSASFLLSIAGIGSLLGRLGNGLMLNSRVPAECVAGLCIATAGASIFLMNVDSYASLAVASFTQGFTSGALFAIVNVLVRRYVGLRSFPICIGLYNFFAGGIGSLLGPILAGWLFDVTSCYKTVFFVMGGLYLASAPLFLLFPLLKRVEPGMGTATSELDLTT